MSAHLGEKIRYLRQQHRLTQAQVADQLKLASSSQVARVESGDPPSMSLVLRIAHLFGVTTDYLLRDTLPVEHVEVTTSVLQSRQESSLPQHFGVKLRALRMQGNLTQEALTSQLGLARQAYISNLEAGRKLPGLDTVVQIANFFGVTTDYLLNDGIPIEQSPFGSDTDD